MTRSRSRGAVAFLALALVTEVTPGAAFAKPPRGSTIALSHDFQPDPHVVPGKTLGTKSASSFGANCVGWIKEDPDALVVLRTPFAFLRLFVVSSEDTTLVLQGPDDKFVCSDDVYGTNPSIEQTFAAGAYRVWVGTKTKGGAHPFQLKLTQDRGLTPEGDKTPSPPATNEAVGTLDSTAKQGTRSTIRIRSGFSPDPRVERGTTQGTVSIQGLAPNASGFVAAEPEYVLWMERPFGYMRVAAKGDAETILLLRTPEGKWMFSRSQPGKGATLEEPKWPTGRYSIWIGSTRKGIPVSYELSATEMRPTK